MYFVCFLITHAILSDYKRKQKRVCMFWFSLVFFLFLFSCYFMYLFVLLLFVFLWLPFFPFWFGGVNISRVILVLLKYVYIRSGLFQNSRSHAAQQRPGRSAIRPLSMHSMHLLCHTNLLLPPTRFRDSLFHSRPIPGNPLALFYLLSFLFLGEFCTGSILIIKE